MHVGEEAGEANKAEYVPLNGSAWLFKKNPHKLSYRQHQNIMELMPDTKSREICTGIHSPEERDLRMN